MKRSGTHAAPAIWAPSTCALAKGMQTWVSAAADPGDAGGAAACDACLLHRRREPHVKLVGKPDAGNPPVRIVPSVTCKISFAP
jgi:hypothetical protein